MGSSENPAQNLRHAEDVGNTEAHTFQTGATRGEVLDEIDAPLELAGGASNNADIPTIIYEEQPAVSKAPVIAEYQRFPSVDEDEQQDAGDAGSNNGDSNQTDRTTDDSKPVTWASLPKKGQLTILTLARLSEPLTQTSLQSYIFYQLKSFDSSLSDSTISWQAGILQGSFTAAQFLTAVWWGRLADMECVGRKKVLLIGLMGSCISCLGFGFSKSFLSVVIFRTMGGMLNSNVGVMRTMIAEIIEEKKRVEPVGGISVVKQEYANANSVEQVPVSSFLDIANVLQCRSNSRANSGIGIGDPSR